MSDLNKKVVKATKWSSLTEIAAKLVSPISTMVLARLLAPEAFGILVTATMVISFAEIFTDAGFQKYLIQHKFETRKNLYESTTVAFWSNLVMSLVIWVGIIVFSDQIATWVGSEGHGDVIAVSCFCIPLAAFSSIQMALYKRDLDFKTLFLVRIIGVLIPLFVTIPLAYFTRSYWSLIVGMIALNLSNAIILTVKSPWKPKLFYSFKLLKEMFSFTVWSMVEAVSIWLTSYVDIFIVGTMLNEHYLGVYRTSMTTVGQIMGLVTAATTPVLFSSLSKLQDDDEGLKKMFFSFQKVVSILVIPLGVGIFLFQDLVTTILLGNQWHEAAHFIGLWGVTSAFAIVLSHYCSEVYRAKGKPKLSVLVQVLHLACLVPVILWAVQYDFRFLCDMRALVRLTLIIINLFVLYHVVRVSFMSMLRNVFPALFATGVMACFAILLQTTSSSMVWQIVMCFACMLVYIGCLMLFPQERKIIVNLKQSIKR